MPVSFDDALHQAVSHDVRSAERHKTNARRAHEPASCVDQARVARVFQIDLRRVAVDDHLRPVPEPSEEHQHLRPRGVLSFLKDDQRIIECSATHERQRHDLDHVARHQALHLFVVHHVMQRI